MNPIQLAWDNAKFKSPFTPPTVYHAFSQNNERFLVISNDSTIFRVMNKQGQVFMVAHFRCKLDETGQYYVCSNPMHIVSCTTYKLEEDQYAYDVIRPLIWPDIK
jgi:hypothetical protein